MPLRGGAYLPPELTDVAGGMGSCLAFRGGEPGGPHSPPPAPLLIGRKLKGLLTRSSLQRLFAVVQSLSRVQLFVTP